MILPSPTVKTPTVLPTKGVSIHETSTIEGGVRIDKGTKVWNFSHILSGATVGESEGCHRLRSHAMAAG